MNMITHMLKLHCEHINAGLGAYLKNLNHLKKRLPSIIIHFGGSVS